VGAEQPKPEYVTDEADLLHDIRDLLTDIRDLLVKQREEATIPPALRGLFAALPPEPRWPSTPRWPGEYHDSDPDK
jgi:hypothetical protein